MERDTMMDWGVSPLGGSTPPVSAELNWAALHRQSLLSWEHAQRRWQMRWS
jgi:hypothetical protein